MKKLLFAILMVPLLAHAWEPTKPVTVIVGNTPGAGNEIAFRKLAEIVQKNNPKFTYVVSNIPGADSVIANNKFLEAAPDGYTLNLPSHMSSYVTNDVWEKNIKKFQWDSFIDVMTIGKSPLTLVAWPKSSVNTPQDFVKLISSTNKPINVALGGGAHRTAFEYLTLARPVTMSLGTSNPCKMRSSTRSARVANAGSNERSNLNCLILSPGLIVPDRTPMSLLYVGTDSAR